MVCVTGRIVGTDIIKACVQSGRIVPSVREWNKRLLLRIHFGPRNFAGHQFLGIHVRSPSAAEGDRIRRLCSRQYAIRYYNSDFLSIYATIRILSPEWPFRLCGSNAEHPNASARALLSFLGRTWEKSSRMNEGKIWKRGMVVGE